MLQRLRPFGAACLGEASADNRAVSPAHARNLLWLTLLLAAPVPIFFVVIGYEPVARLLQLLGITLAFIAVEGPAGIMRTVVLLLAVQALLWAAVLRFVAAAAVGAMARGLGRKRVAAATLAVAAAIVAGASLYPIYRTPFRSASLHATLLEVFE